MSARNLIVIGGIWFGAAALWISFGRTSVSIAWLGKGSAAKVAGTAAVYALGVSYILFLLGWMLPMGIGIYRLIGKH